MCPLVPRPADRASTRLVGSEVRSPGLLLPPGHMNIFNILQGGGHSLVVARVLSVQPPAPLLKGENCKVNF